jgi:hypothetical protein
VIAMAALLLMPRRDVRAAPSRFEATLGRASVHEAEGASAGPGT